MAFGHNLEDVWSRSLNDFHDLRITCKHAVDILKHLSIDLLESILVIIELTGLLFDLVGLDPTKFEVVTTIYDYQSLAKEFGMNTGAIFTLKAMEIFEKVVVLGVVVQNVRPTCLLSSNLGNLSSDLLLLVVDDVDQVAVGVNREFKKLIESEAYAIWTIAILPKHSSQQPDMQALGVFTFLIDAWINFTHAFTVAKPDATCCIYCHQV